MRSDWEVINATRTEPFGEGWMSKEMGEATSVLAALGGDDE